MNPEDTSSPFGGSPSLSPSEPSSLKQIRTFQGDVAEALKNQGESLVSIQSKEVERAKELIREKEASARAAANPELPTIEVPARKEPLVVKVEETLSAEDRETRHRRRQGFLLGLGTLLLLGGGAWGGWTAYVQ